PRAILSRICARHASGSRRRGTFRSSALGFAAARKAHTFDHPDSAKGHDDDADPHSIDKRKLAIQKRLLHCPDALLDHGDAERVETARRYLGLPQTSDRAAALCHQAEEASAHGMLYDHIGYIDDHLARRPDSPGKIDIATRLQPPIESAKIEQRLPRAHPVRGHAEAMGDI